MIDGSRSRFEGEKSASNSTQQVRIKLVAPPTSDWLRLVAQGLDSASTNLEKEVNVAFVYGHEP
jgi:hypothetical protein